MSTCDKTPQGCDSGLPVFSHRPIEAVLEVESPPAPAASATATAAAAEPADYDEGQPLSDEIVLSDAGKPLNAVPSARGADESARGHLRTEPSLCQQVRLALSKGLQLEQASLIVSARVLCGESCH